MSATGKVWLVGAGPGDPGLITMAGVACLAGAEAVVYDRLVDPRLLDLAPPDAERISVGKAAASHSLPQEDINALLVAKAREGKSVVRLKGGDPFVFGRGGEEAEALAAAGIPFEVVPGVTSAVAVPAYAGIPVTHRRMASSFAVVTGHEDPTKDESSIDWEHLAKGVDTLVFLMGGANLGEIARRLVECGRAPHTPTAVVRWGTTPHQQTVAGTLADIADRVAKAGLTPPVVTVVGEVAALRDKLRWYDNRPLFGKRILVTRARGQAGVLSQALAELGAEPVELPAIEIKPRVERLCDTSTPPSTTGSSSRAPTASISSSITYVKQDATPAPWAAPASARSGRERRRCSRASASSPTCCRSASSPRALSTRFPNRL